MFIAKLQHFDGLERNPTESSTNSSITFEVEEAGSHKERGSAGGRPTLLKKLVKKLPKSKKILILDNMERSSKLGAKPAKAAEKTQSFVPIQLLEVGLD